MASIRAQAIEALHRHLERAVTTARVELTRDADVLVDATTPAHVNVRPSLPEVVEYTTGGIHWRMPVVLEGRVWAPTPAQATVDADALWEATVQAVLAAGASQLDGLVLDAQIVAGDEAVADDTAEPGVQWQLVVQVDFGTAADDLTQLGAF